MRPLSLTVAGSRMPAQSTSETKIRLPIGRRAQVAAPTLRTLLWTHYMPADVALKPLILAPLYMPTPDWVLMVDRSGAKSVPDLVEDAKVECGEVLPSSDRLVVLTRSESLAAGELGPLLCEPGPNGAVVITVSGSLSGVDAARQCLAVLAYALFDPTARRVVRGQPWSRLVVDEVRHQGERR